MALELVYGIRRQAPYASGEWFPTFAHLPSHKKEALNLVFCIHDFVLCSLVAQPEFAGVAKL